MRLGVIFPQLEIGSDPEAVRSYAQAVEGMGYDHLAIFDHVLGVDPTNRPGWDRYTHRSMFHEPMVLFGYLAAITQRLELATSILILPQRQAALVAKQAAEADVLSGGRLRLGVGLGWNEVEYEALNEDFHTRGRRLAEQIEVMRLLWTQPVVDFHGQWHNVTEAGINPPPVQQPIPVWVGGSAEPALKRIAKVADGWFPNGPPDETRRAMVEMFKGFVKEAGRDMADIGVEARINVANGNVDDWRRGAEAWRSMGATHLSVMSEGAGFSLDDHIDALRQGKEAIADIIRA